MPHAIMRRWCSLLLLGALALGLPLQHSPNFNTEPSHLNLSDPRNGGGGSG